MVERPAPDLPPWAPGQAPTAIHIKSYVPYLWVEIELRDVKQRAIVHHIEEHCQ